MTGRLPDEGPPHGVVAAWVVVAALLVAAPLGLALLLLAAAALERMGG